MANPRYNTQVTQPRGSSARVGKMGGGMMRPMYKKGGTVKKDYKLGTKFQGDYKGKSVPGKVKEFVKTGVKQTIGTAKKIGEKFRVKKMAGGRIAGAARRAQEHGYYTPDMGMKGGRMYKSGGKVGKKKPPRVMGIGIGKIKDYPGMKKIIEMNKKGKKRFRDGGMTKGVKEDPIRDRMKQPLKKIPKDPNKTRPKTLRPVKSSQKGLKKLPTEVRNKMGFMKDGGMARRRNTSRMNRLEELGRVDAEKGFTRKGKRNLRAEKKRIVKELRK